MGFFKKIFGGTSRVASREQPLASPAPAEQPAQPVACPYCGVVLDAAPTRSRKCPDCGAKIIVRTRRSDGAKLYLTEDAAKVFDGERESEARRNEAIRAASNIGLDKTDFERMEKELLSKSQHYSPGDVFWALANELLVQQMRDGDEHGLSLTYFEMALWQHNSGAPYSYLKVESEKARARSYAAQGCQRLELRELECCENCGRYRGVYPIEQALSKWPVPVEECTNGWCLCSWLPVAAELALADESGDVLDLHFNYLGMIQRYYGDRDSNPEALDLAIDACEKQIALAPKSADAFRCEYPDQPLPAHTGYSQLAIIREKQKDYHAAIELSEAALRQGWMGDWEKRIARNEKRLARS